MGRVLTEIDAATAEWMARQHVFFVATAPLSRHGHVNCSPKGGDTFRIIDPRTFAFQDLTGSGAETIAHVRENGRMVIMFCAFEGGPLIVRLYGLASVLLPETTEYEALAGHFPPNPGTRAIVRLGITRVSNSCGMGVPRCDFRGDRSDLDEWAEAKGARGLQEYRTRKNQTSIDGLAALEPWLQEPNPREDER